MGPFKTICIALALSLIAGRVIAQMPSNGFRFNDPADQAGFIEAVRKAGVKFNIRDDGTLIYDPADEERVSKIQRKFIEDSFTPSIHFPNPALEARVIKALDAAQIPHGVRVRDGKRYITWAEGDNSRADAIVDAEVDAEIESRARND